jgi:hypothetical protein
MLNLPDSGHVLPLDNGRDEIINAIDTFFNETTSEAN